VRVASGSSSAGCARRTSCMTFFFGAFCRATARASSAGDSTGVGSGGLLDATSFESAMSGKVAALFAITAVGSRDCRTFGESDVAGGAGVMSTCLVEALTTDSVEGRGELAGSESALVGGADRTLFDSAMLVVDGAVFDAIAF